MRVFGIGSNNCIFIKYVGELEATEENWPKHKMQREEKESYFFYFSELAY